MYIFNSSIISNYQSGETLKESTENTQLDLVTFEVGPVLSNAYLLADTTSKMAVVIDPGDDGGRIARSAQDRDWKISYLWLTHAHFDHFGGAAQLADSLDHAVEVGLHPQDLSLWRAQGGAPFFGLNEFDPGPEPTISLEDGMKLHLGSHMIEVRHTPGHSPGHVVFVIESQKLVFCGDLIFNMGVGRTDLPGGSWNQLLSSIQESILTLPDDFRLLPGHGPQTTVGEERRSNPFLR
jgi:glyoxylase-like metal-dependent hydrolase (beta-lactamase superfamily II)